MTRSETITAASCPVGYATCPGTHSCLFRAAGAWKSCSAVVLRGEHLNAPAESPPRRNGQDLAA